MSKSRGPDLDLDWEEGLFRLVRGMVRRVFRREPEAPPGQVLLEDLADRLAGLASLIAGRRLRVAVARERGGVRGDVVLLPAEVHLSTQVEDNVLVYVVRAVLAGWLAAERPDEVDVELVQASVAALNDEFPGFRAGWERVRSLEGGPLDDSVLWGPVFVAPARDGTASMPGEPDGGVSSDATEMKAPAIEEVTLHEMGEEPLELPVHAFEKVEMAESFGGTFRRPDGSDELDDHVEALEEVDLGHLLRGGPSAGSLLKADLDLDADIPNVEDIDDDEPSLRYDEWDARAGRYRRGWCRVVPTAMPGGDGAWSREAASRHRRTIDRLLGQLLRRRQRLRPRPRSLQGDDIDIDALSNAWATLRAGRSPSRRLYVEPARVQRDVATLVLLDVSLSTDSWVADRRVLDVARESVLVLGEVLEQLGEEVEILAFASHTRHKVRCWTVRGWGEPWSVGRGRLGRLQPQGYTRIGPALRHATARLARRPEKHRDLILVSDCKPTDYDRYEGRHGVRDVRKALGEARQLGVRPQALAIDAVAAGWLPAMFGAGRWSVLPSPDALPDALVEACAR
ncbi:MAG: hypothetical protein GY913_10590 [Proteobacteria bacterium]|nr:hypothetical protein [Pseudomonadota bacterium]MCP4917360.1 hypothetical protein [Pseudomonadota bacterium]